MFEKIYHWQMLEIRELIKKGRKFLRTTILVSDNSHFIHYKLFCNPDKGSALYFQTEH